MTIQEINELFEKHLIKIKIVASIESELLFKDTQGKNTITYKDQVIQNRWYSFHSGFKAGKPKIVKVKQIKESVFECTHCNALIDNKDMNLISSGHILYCKWCGVQLIQEL